MKRSLAILLLCCLMLSLCACGSGREAENGGAEVSGSPVVWHGRLTSRFPLGMEGKITGMAAFDGILFTGGDRDGQAELLRCPYVLEEDGPVWGEETALEIPASPVSLRLAALGCGFETCAVLFASVPEEEKDLVSWSVGLYGAAGNLEENFTISLPGDAVPRELMLTGENDFCIREVHRLHFFNLAGEPLWSVEDYEVDYEPLLLLDGTLYLSAWTGTAETELFRVDTEARALMPVETVEPVPAAQSICQSPGGQVLLNDSESLLQLNQELRSSALLAWYDMTGDYGSSYRLVCRLGDRDFLLVPREESLLPLRQDSSEQISLHLFSTVPSRSIRIAFYGWSETQQRTLEALFKHYIPDYAAECVRFGTEEAEKTRLMLEVNAGKIDLVLCDWYELEPGPGFADLAPFLEKDELLRAELPDWLLENLSTRGEIRNLWCSFTVDTWMARGALAVEPGPLRLKDCQAILDREGVETPLFDSYMTRSWLLESLSGTLLARAWDGTAGTYRLDRPAVRELLEFLLTQPLEDPYHVLEGTGADPALWRSESLLPLELGVQVSISDQEGASSKRYFDGWDGGDDLSVLICAPMSCCMIPDACPDKENAWAFLRQLLSEDVQMALYKRGGQGLPVNRAAYEALVSAGSSLHTQETLRWIEENSPVMTYQLRTLGQLLSESLEPWLTGDKGLDEALALAQSRIDLYMAERA